MPRFSSANHHLVKAVAWEPELPGDRIHDHILMSKGTSNAYLVTTEAGDVVINTGMPYQGARHRERFEALLGRPLEVRKIILTQSHPDHMGGWTDFAGPGVETIITRCFPDIQRERALLGEYFKPRGARVVGGLLPNPEHLKAWKPEANAEAFQAATLFGDSHEFQLGGRRFELYPTPSGETLDSLVVWMPEERTLFTGNLLGALYGALPHFYTPRGDRDRSVAQFLRDIERLIAFQPELLITGHDDPIKGADRIGADLVKLRDAVRYIHDRTVEGMNAHKDLFTLMAEIKLPAELQTAPGRGPVRWYVRAVWEEYAGWFRQESTTELYAVPPRAVWTELAEMAGGPDALADRARAHVAAGRPVEALHFTDIALAADPTHRATREAEIAALEALVDQSEGRFYDETAWLESKIRDARAVLD